MVDKEQEINMPSLVLVGYATKYGSTREVAEAVAAVLRDGELEVDVKPIKEVRSLTAYKAVMLGAPLYMFHWHKDALRFLSRFRSELAERPVAIFCLGPTHDPFEEIEWKEARSQLDKDLVRFSWLKPVAIKMFGGKYDPGKLKFPLNLFAGQTPASDLRDWNEIRAWAKDLTKNLGLLIR